MATKNAEIAKGPVGGSVAASAKTARLTPEPALESGSLTPALESGTQSSARLLPPDPARRERAGRHSKRHPSGRFRLRLGPGAEGAAA